MQTTHPRPEPEASVFVSIFKMANGTGSTRQFVSKATRLKLPSGLCSRQSACLQKEDPGDGGSQGLFNRRVGEGLGAGGGTPPSTTPTPPAPMRFRPSPAVILSSLFPIFSFRVGDTWGKGE